DDGEAAGDHRHDRQHRRENRPFDEEMRELHRVPPVGAVAGPVADAVRVEGSACVVGEPGAVSTSAPGGIGCSVGLTFVPGRARWRPLTMTRSPGLIPDSIDRRSPNSAPSFTGCISTTSSGFTTITNRRFWSAPTATSGMSKAMYRPLPGTRT